MNIYLSVNNREQVIKLPVLPNEFMVNTGMKNESYDTIRQGEIKLIGLENLKTIKIQSFFPSKRYNFLRDNKYKGWRYVEMIEGWKSRRVPIRLIITNTPINMPCTIEGFEYGIKDGTNDIYYTLTLSEFKFIKLKKKGV
ncbi:phage portal protein [Clostridiaceae bacterium M8S5]|nr:phage portal protein [Clostridiaceae bacterium M8S5]